MSQPRHITVTELLNLDCKKWHLQRTINHEVVERYKQHQLAIIKERGHPVILGDFVFAQFPNELFLLDGHHRFEMLRQLLNNKINIGNTMVQVQIFECRTIQQANRLYEMANDRYSINGNINDQGTVHIRGDTAVAVVDRLRSQFNNFKNQNKVRNPLKNLCAPYFDVNDLLSQLNQNSELLDRSVDEIVTLIINKNKDYMKNLSLDQRTKCRDGFYLCYGQTKCKWVENLLK
jgi:hypothetical protein